jgi:hypothetical protein
LSPAKRRRERVTKETPFEDGTPENPGFSLNCKAEIEFLPVLTSQKSGF